MAALGVGLGVSIGGIVASFLPSDISDLVSWLKGDTGKTINTNSGTDYVSEWEDQVGGKIWVQSVLTYQPLNATDYIDFRNLSVLRRKDADWDSSSDGFPFEGIKRAPVAHNSGGSSGHTFVYVIQIEEDRGGSTNGFYALHQQYYFDDTTPGAPYGNSVTNGGGTTMYLDGDFFYQVGSSATATSFNSGTSAGTEMDYDTKLILTFRHEGGTNGYVKYYRNGDELTMTNTLTKTLGAGTVDSLGSGTNNAGFTGRMYETLVYDSALSDDDFSTLHSHLKTKYNIS